MRLFVRRALASALALGAAASWSGCTPKKQTQYVAGISTQVQVPRDLRSVRVTISIGGAVQLCRNYRAYNGQVQLPRSLGAYALNDPGLSGPVSYTIVGYAADVPEGDDGFCDTPTLGDSPPRILRRSTQPYLAEKILFLPMPLKYACFDREDCGDPSLTCKAGKCVSADTDPTTLPEYSPELLDGTGGACFSIDACLGPRPKPAVLVDPTDCTYAVANTPSEPDLIDGAPDVYPGDEPLGEGLNVIVTYDGGLVREVLDKDAEEGFIVPDPTKPQRFRLVPGLCEMVKGVDDKGKPVPHRITALHASDLCRSKNKFQPICASDQLEQMTDVGAGTGTLPPPDCIARELSPPESSLVLVVDNTKGHAAFFDQAEAQAVQISLDDPAFSRTKLGLVYAPGALACSAGAPDVPLELTATAKGKIIQSFGQYTPPTPALPLADGAPSFEGALARAYEAFGTEDIFRRAVLVFGNRDFNPAVNQCTASGDGPAQLAQAAKTGGLDIDTYVLLLAKTQGDDAASSQALLEANALAVAGGGLEATDARQEADKADAKELFQNLVESLATCVYDVPDPPASADPFTDPSPPPADGTLSYLEPIFQRKYIIPPGNCSGEGAPGVGWGYGTQAPAPGVKRIFLCQDSCDEYRSVLKAASAFNLTFGKPSPAVPIFAHKPGCGPARDPEP
ncbi:MAG: hypothetical protein MUF34_02270 [Polyangiaceae bacterium]|nr:hypothetical protein [Polyangiaceae bacterium]